MECLRVKKTEKFSRKPTLWLLKSCLPFVLSFHTLNHGTQKARILDFYCHTPANNCIKRTHRRGTILFFAITGRHRGSSTFYLENNSSLQIKLGEDVELQDTIIVHVKSLRGVMQDSTVGARLDLGSKLVNWYQNATFAAFKFRIFHHGEKMNRVSVQTTGLLPQTFIYPSD